jgi:phasin family protein
MFDVTQQLSAIHRANLDATARFVAVSFDDAERLFRLQHDTTRRLFAENVEAIKAMVGPDGNGEALAEWPRRYAANLNCIFDATRECFELVSHTQAELVRLMNEQAATINRSVTQTARSLAGSEGSASGAAAAAGETRQGGATPAA